MKKRLIALALPLWVIQAHGQTFTTYGPPDPVSIDAGYVSDYSPDGTVIQTGGSVTLANGSTYEHGNLNFQNNGIWLGQTGSLDLFSAAGALTISGSAAPGFLNLQFQNGNTISLTNTAGANIAGQLTFGTSGIISTTRNTHTISSLRFADGATYTGGNTDAQHVNGYVTKTGDDAFLFPVGSGTDLRTVFISGTTAATSISTAWFAGSPATVTDPSDGATHSLTAVAAPVESVSPVGFWDWINPAGSDDNVAVMVSIPDMTDFALPSNLRLVGWDGTQWVALSAGTTAIDPTENSPLSGTIPAGVSITALAIGSVQPPLPVTLVSFTGKAVENTVALEWVTTEEINASHFEVQRSRDAKRFESIGKVEAKGESKDVINYAFYDQAPLAGTNYYRLKQLDLDGTYAFSKTISIRFNAEININVYPNPVTDVLRIESSAGLQSLEIFNIDGLKVTGKTVRAGNASAATSGANFREIDLRDQKPGIYVLVVNGRSFKVLKN
jgi:hypothetical protein